MPDPTTLPRLAAGDLTYLGAFRVPYTNAPTSRPTANFSGGVAYQGGGHYMAFNPAGNGGAGSLFVSGIEQGSVAEITIPAPISSTTLTALNQASYLQNFYDISEGQIAASIAAAGVEASMTGLAIANGKLVATMSELYGTTGLALFTHFTHDLNLATPSVQTSRVSTPEGLAFAYLSGFMTNVPDAWQPLLGGPFLTGQMGLSIVGRTSAGPGAAFAFDPTDIGSGPITDAVALQYYSLIEGQHPLGPWDGQNGTYGAVTFIRGMQIIANTSTLLVWGRNSNQPYKYGMGTNDPALDGTPVPGEPGVIYYYDPMFPTSKGQHGYPYTFQFWAYDLNDLAAVKAGTKEPWEVAPYGVWPMTQFPIDYVSQSGAMAYDEAGGKLYLAQLDVDRNNGLISTAPLIHVFSLSNSGPPSTGYPLLTRSQVLGTYLGAFLLPGGTSGPGYTWEYAGIGGMDFDPLTGRIYILMNGFGLCEISIPTLVVNSDPAFLYTATITQPAVDPGEGQITADMGSPNIDWRIGGVARHGDYVYLNAYRYYDANAEQVRTHFRHDKTLSTVGGYAGLDEVSWAPFDEAGWVSTIMGRVPSEWQDALGGALVCGGGGIPIITRQPFGHSLYTFDPADINVVAEPVPTSCILGHPSSHTLGGGEWGAQSTIWNGSSVYYGVTMLNETRNCLIVGMQGIGPWYYGNGDGSDPGGYVDPGNPHHGTHAYPYRHQIWMYDIEDLAAVKAGTKQPWEPIPQVWAPVFPTVGISAPIMGSCYDPTNQILYLCQARAYGTDYKYPIMHAYQVGGGGGTPPDPPIPPTPPRNFMVTVGDTETV